MRPRIELLFLIAGVSPLAAQGRDVDLRFGRWYQGNHSTTYELRTDAPLAGVFSHGLTAQMLIHDSLGRHRAFYGAGWQVHAFRRRSIVGPYLLGGVSLGLSTDTTSQAFAALWTFGAGVEWRPIPWAALGFESVYRLQDIGPRGFWRESSGSRDGIAASVGMSLTIGRGVDRRWTRSGRDMRTRPEALPPPAPPTNITGNAADIVRTALDVVGTPYVWGGTAANGFDCSGLVQWAYGQHGIRLPRVSRDQARSGSEVMPVIEALLPGDILLFAAQPGGGVTHVGMYVGDRLFIHSSNNGVKLSRLESTDTDGTWWVSRWVGARRIIQ